MYLDQPLQTYLNDLASDRPTPGGGSTAALSGAMGAALACMVARLTLGRADYADVQSEIETLLPEIEQVRARFQDLIQADIDAYSSLSASLKLPRSTPAEKSTRTQTIQERLIEAASIPLEMAERAADLIRHCQHIARIGNKNVLSDIATASTLAVSAGTGASWMVHINAQSLKDRTLARELQSRLEKALETITIGSQLVITIIGERA